jgi:hypothetical protein
MFETGIYCLAQRGGKSRIQFSRTLYRVVDLDPEIILNSWNPLGLRSRSRKELELLEKKTRSWHDRTIWWLKLWNIIYYDIISYIFFYLNFY